MHPHWAHVGRGAAAMGAAMGIGRFAYTPILPLMTTQAAIAPALAGQLATANYAGYQRGRVRHRRHLDARPPRRSFTAHVGMGFRWSAHRHRSLRAAASRIG
ncbi:YbfB/YjiJ family MFS transporter [Mycobacterium sp. ITM-2016-00318]|uniref:YbfB/YjiJ family MFS transporter n=1 Tax=Mycobacterium sp. ITM-2016-00318 TaxID=2099693 RepID=UPI001E63D852|nr:YbfB/YjiJ family MFS transporter [Mycobacterium sp. ITM-2016-00318]WNG92179.1 YbfB/YjiJ family MFS transporter [Mycobacterium sp. ITM-2016-00318]